VAFDIGTRLGSYEIGELAGRGGMGEVYRARDSRLKRTVAIKILPAAFAADSDRVRRFEQEAETLAALTHPNIAAIHAIEEAGGTRFLVLEFVEGETLAERLARGPADAREATAIALQICSALAAAHDRGIVHRDLKPANIKIAPAGHVKLLDFGLARMLAPEASTGDLSQSPTVTAASAGHVIAGTAAYMAPEQARGKPVDKRADMWALGCVLYEMLTARPLFTGETVTDILAAVVTQEPRLEALPAATPAPLRWVIGRCLQKDPNARLRDAADAAALVASGWTVGEDARPRTRRWLPAAAAALAALATAALAWLWPSKPHATDMPMVRFDVAAAGAPLAQPMAVSPDGRRIAYAAAGGTGGTRLWMRSLDDPEPKEIPGSEATRRGWWFPAWSPDGASIAFVADGKLKRADIGGGGAETLATLDNQIGGLAWGRGNDILFASNNHGLRRIAPSGGAVVEITQRDAALEESFHDCPAFLPDGRHFLYLGYSESKVENRALYVSSLDAPSKHARLMSSSSCAVYATGYILFSRGQTLMARPFDLGQLAFTGEPKTVAEKVATFSGDELAAFAASDAGTLVYRTSAQSEWARNIVWVDRGGKASAPVGETITPGVGPTIRLSPDDKRFAFSSPGPDTPNDDIWTYDFERQVRLRLTTGPDVDHIPAWSPDGSRVLFDSHRGGSGSALYDVPSTGAVAEQMVLKLDGTDFIAGSDWSRDNRFIVFHRSPSGSPPWSLWGLPLTGERKPFAYKTGAADYIGARLSPNVRWLAYATNESGAYQVVVQPFPDPAGGKWQVSTAGGMLPVWRGDGRELYYLATSGDLMAVPVTTDPTFMVGKATTLFRTTLPAVAQGSTYDAARDGQRFLMAVPVVNTTPPITTVLNWPSLIRSK